MASPPTTAGGSDAASDKLPSPSPILPLTRLQENRLLAVLTCSTLLVYTNINMLAPLLLELAGEFHMSLGAVGQLTAAAAIPWAVLAPVMGALSDRYGRKPVFASGLVVFAVATIASSTASDFSSLFVIRLLGGIGGATTGPNTMAAAADYFPPARRGWAMGFVMAGMSLATVVGVPLTAFGAAHFGWRPMFVVVGILMFLMAATVWLLLPPIARAKHAGSYLSGFAETLRNRTTVLLLAANLAERCSFMAVTTYLAAFLMQSYSVSLDQVAPVLSVIALGTLLGSILGGKMADKGSPRTQYAALMVVTAAVAYPLFASSPGIVLTGMLAAIFGIAGALARPAWLWLITKVPADRRGATTGFAATTNQTGMVLGSALGGMLVGVGGYAPLGIMASCGAILSAVICFRSRAN